ncbi:tubulin-tyrosine ligase family protein (macronuclear) [Tetrahymena thermophila SB210]|uniref:Tubulin-tyrosine ligase family protein n=1 Tax=Tetrahymena thermophila (strain SB210) TaxID=312017 RepID=I7LVA2_TETTS|nr:tubulin-tyrosine ligase family protein [Tetrahymena thermophila SB210]EAR97536.2 tubulin-tyrosine ligase family protein [Tetrahymena thermophila SB210]|eukprot:XP_001017781.2 tubulin-tyrosine ligase family protein [Tetrahymena thermophila SB210]
MSLQNLNDKQQLIQDDEQMQKEEQNQQFNQKIVNIDQGREGIDYENIYNPKIEEGNQEQAEIEINLEEEQDDKQYPFMCLSEVVKMTRNIKKNKKIVFDVTDTIYKVIKNQGSVTMGWTTITSPPQNREEWNICWYDTYISEEVLRRMLPYQKINHFPGSHNLGKKNYLAANLTRMRKVLENEYSFFPKTWTLPLQFEDFKRYNENIKTKKPYYIVKPESSCQGRGIYLTKKVENFSYNDHCVIQEYIKNPFLIDGLKFDFRIYVLIKNINPLKIFMYPEGLARFATVKYQKPNKKNCQNFTMHLTNYAVNKKNPNFIFNENDQNDDVGHKRSFSSVLKQLHNMGKDIPKLYMEIRQLIVKTVISVQPQLSHIYRSSQPKEYQNEMCFEVLGFDVMIDKELKPWLLEVNHSASFHCDSPLDFSIKKNVILDTLNILNVSSKEKKKYLDIKSQAQFAYRKKDQKASAETENNKVDQEKIIKYENKHKGAFIRIYPAEDDPADYDKLLKTASNLWNETVSPKKVNPAVAAQNNHNSQSSSSTQKNGDPKNTKSTPFKKPVSQDSHSVLNSTQVSQAKSEQKTKAPNSTKKNLSQVFDDQRDKTQESFLNFLPNLSNKGTENQNTGGTTLRQKQGATFLENNPISIIPSLSQVYLRNDANKQVESQMIMNNFDDENCQLSNEKDQQEDILSNIVGKKRSMTQIESHAKMTQDSSKQYLIHNQSFQYPLTQQHSSNKLNQSPHLQDQYKASVLGNIVGKGLIYQDNPNLVQIPQQQNQINQNNNNLNPTVQYSRNNHFNQKNLDNFNEDAIQLKHSKFNNFNLDQIQNSALQYNPFLAMQQPQSLENQRKLNIVNLGMSSPEQIINESWYSQTQKPAYLRNSTRKPYKAQLKPLSQDLQNMMQRENRSNNGNKLSNIANDSVIQAGTQPKYLGGRKNNIAANIIQKYPHYSHQQNLESQKQVDYTAAEQIIQRTKNNSMPSKNYRQELHQPSFLTNQNINNNNNNIIVSPFQINIQNNQQSNNQINNNTIFSNINSNNNNNNNNVNINTLNTQISFNYNNNNSNNISNYSNGKNIIQQEVQMSYSKRRILKKSIDRKHVKDMIMNESIAGNYKADQFSKHSIKPDQVMIPSYTQIRNKTTDSIDNFTNQNNYSYNIESQTIGGLNHSNQNQTAQIISQNNTPILQAISPQGKNIDQQNIMALKNQEQPLIITSNMNSYQGNLQNKNTSNNFNNILLYGNAQQINSNNLNDNKIYQKNQFIVQQNKLLQIKK